MNALAVWKSFESANDYVVNHLLLVVTARLSRHEESYRESARYAFLDLHLESIQRLPSCPAYDGAVLKVRRIKRR